MNEEKTNSIALVEIPCPPELFETENAYIERRKRIPVWKIDDLKLSKSSQEMYTKVAPLIPRWVGVRDCETGELLPNPEEDPTVIGRLDMEQQQWLGDTLRMLPGKLKKFTQSART